jgi:RNA polymerase sigma-32 factor
MIDAEQKRFLNLGLLQAVYRFDPGGGVRLSAFAIHWIRAQINEYILRNWRMVKMATAKAQCNLFYNLRRLRRGLEPLNNAETIEIASELDATAAVVQEMDMRFNGGDCPYDGWNDGEYQAAPAAYLEDLRYEPGRLV